MSYICDTPKDENHYRIHEESQTILPEKHPPNTKNNRPKTRQHKRKRKSNWGRRIGKSDGVMVMERVVSEIKRIKIFF